MADEEKPLKDGEDDEDAGPPEPTTMDKIGDCCIASIKVSTQLLIIKLTSYKMIYACFSFIFNMIHSFCAFVCYPTKERCHLCCGECDKGCNPADDPAYE